MYKRIIWIPIILIISLFLAPAAPQSGERFTDNGDGTVTDHLMGVMWGKTDNQGNIDWKQAERWVKYTFPYSLPPEKSDGWRLPTLKELQSLYVEDKTYKGYESDCGKDVRIVPQIRLTCGWVWTSERKGITARIFSFQKGYHFTDRISHKRSYRALPVKTLKLNK